MTEQDPALEPFHFDSRGVRRTYGVSLDDGQLRIWRDDPKVAYRRAE